ncbi:hypothetical protein CCHR01_16913 [Colletotrichum chrysophilum]|uniref:Uncharacterized protein n=1 Tax=Colletotrichum chrysophilum TaxID=1836956 RepID=A0AAD9A317_9PEZI|nr:hypothetical protein CCHR01_16913 [Colletotrichum chrysophilum]
MATPHDQVGPASIPTEIFSMILEKMRDEILQSTTPVVWKLRLERVCPYSLRDDDPSVVSVQSDPNEDAQSGGSRAKARLRHLSPLRGINKKGRKLVMECFEVLPCSDSRHPPMFVRTDYDIFIPGKHQFYAEHVWKMGRFFYRPQPQLFTKIKHIQYDPLDFPYCSYWKTLRRAEPLLQCLESVILKDTTIHLALEHELLPSNGDMVPLTNHVNGLQLLFLVRLRNMASSLPRFHDRWKPFKRRGVRLLVRESDVLQPSVEIVSTEQGLHLRRT